MQKVLQEPFWVHFFGAHTIQTSGCGTAFLFMTLIIWDIEMKKMKKEQKICMCNFRKMENSYFEVNTIINLACINLSMYFPFEPWQSNLSNSEVYSESWQTS